MSKGGDKTMLKEIIENVHVKDRNKLNQYQHRHFHPSGQSHPSLADQKATKRLVQCGKLMGIDLSVTESRILPPL